MQEFKNHFGDHYVDGEKALAVSFIALTASSIYFGDFLGALISAPINDLYGRKAVFWFASGCILVGGIAQVADMHYEGVLIAGRIFIGLGVGPFQVTSLLYIGEVAPLQCRGPALYMFQFLQSWSQLVAAGIIQGTAGMKSSLSYKIPMGGLILLPLLVFIGLPFIPESPVWLNQKGRREDAARSLRTIHKSEPNYDPSLELAIMDEARIREQEHAGDSSWKALITDPIERKKMIWSCGSMYAQQVCGILFFYVYSVIFAQAIGIKQPFTIQLITDILQIIAVTAAVLTGNKVRRRTNLLVTTSMMFFAFIVIRGIGTEKTLTTGSEYVIVIFSFVVVVTFNLGLSPLAYAVAREVATGANQNKVMSLAIATFYFVTWIISFTAPYLYYTADMGPKLGFVYAATTLTSLVWVYFCVGKTTGRTNLELQMFFEQNVPARKWRTHVFDSAPEEMVEERRASVRSMNKLAEQKFSVSEHVEMSPADEKI